MTIRDLWNKCDECGRLVAYQDFADGRAVHRIIAQDSEWTDESYVTLCTKHAALVRKEP